MPAMDQPKAEKIESTKVAKKVIRYLGLMAKERKSLKRIEDKYKTFLRSFMNDGGHSRLEAIDGSYATLEDTERKKWDYIAIAVALDISVEELESRFAAKTIGTRLTCRVPA